MLIGEGVLLESQTIFFNPEWANRLAVKKILKLQNPNSDHEVSTTSGAKPEIRSPLNLRGCGPSLDYQRQSHPQSVDEALATSLNPT
jgi:hypothetical protein